MDVDLSDPRGVAPEFEQRRVEALLVSRMFGDDAPGTRIGRFTVLDRVGRGGMGDVYAAYDPQLDRKVALKLLHRLGSDERVLREARTMASINHPNVAQIYEVGVNDDRVFIAMEFVQGQTLRAWVGAGERSWREVLAMYLQAGCGLVAAHRAGIVHRDFKPENVLVGEEGRVRVVDFGLARETLAERTGELDAAASVRDDRPAADATMTGSLAGTPAYMAPEQFRGRGADERSDQFAFCVALHEALYGERPYRGGTPHALFAAVERGELHVGRSAPTIPDWVARPVRRGLDPDADARHSSMQALLDALANDPSLRRRRVMLAGASLLTVGVVVAGVDGFRRYERAQQVAACEADGASIDEVWNDHARARLREGLLATGVSFAPTTAERVMPWLDDQADALRDARTQVCLATEVQRSWDADIHDRAQQCLEMRAMELAALVSELSAPTTEVVQQAIPAAAELSRVEQCTDAALLARLPMPPFEQRESIREVRSRLSYVRALEGAGKYEAALEAARAAKNDAEALGWAPLTAEAELAVGRMLEFRGAYVEAGPILEDAYFRATMAGAHEVAAIAGSHLVFPHGSTADMIQWSRHAEASIAAAAGSESLLATTWLDNLGSLRSNLGEYDKAKVFHERALAILESKLGPDHPRVASTLNKLALLEQDYGNLERTKALHQRALAIRQAALGPEHPATAGSINNLAMVHVLIGEPARAKELYERSLLIVERALGPDHPRVAGVLEGLGWLAFGTGAYREAKALHRRALAINEAAFGRESNDAADNALTLGHDHLALGEYAEAKVYLERALAIKETLRPELGPAVVLTGLAKLALATTRPADALALAERAAAILVRNWRPGVDLDNSFVLACALWEAPEGAGRDRKRAVALAVRARDAYRTYGKVQQRPLAEVEAWLRRVNSGDENAEKK